MKDLYLQKNSNIFQNESAEVPSAAWETFLNTEVVVLGLSSMGISVVRNLIGSGIRKIRVVDDGVITKKTLSLQTTFGLNDIGKIKGIALKEKELGRLLGDRLQLSVVQLSKENADLIIPSSCRLIIDAAHDANITNIALDLAEEKDFFVIGGLVFGWDGVFGLYAKRDVGFRTLLDKFVEEKQGKFKEFSTGITSFCLGGMISSLVLGTLLYGDSQESRLYKYNSRLQMLDVMN